VSVSARSGPPILRVEHLCVEFRMRGPIGPGGKRSVRAVDDVTLSVPRGGTLGLVGQSGSGKSTLARTILRLVPAVSGRVLFDDVNVLELPPRKLRPLRSRMQMVFQDPYGSLNPRLRVETQIGEALQVHGLAHTARQRRERVGEALAQVGLSGDDGRRYPHEFSGGQRQRIGIARAIVLRPALLICDEPVSALDVSVQAQILNLLMDLQDALGLSYLLITHNLAVARQCCDEVAVMYGGRIVEQGPPDVLFHHPKHAHTQALRAAALDPAAAEQQAAEQARTRRG
jgi:ABC-type oligopeptide transport system ATPase subunit